jgi:hypothetical protein
VSERRSLALILKEPASRAAGSALGSRQQTATRFVAKHKFEFFGGQSEDTTFALARARQSQFVLLQGCFHDSAVR